MDWDLVFKILGSVVAILGGVYQLRQYNPARRNRLKTDYELLEKMKDDADNYNILKAHIDSQVRKLYVEKQSGFKIYDPGQFIFGIVFVVGFTIWSVYIYTNSSGFNWWIVLTGFLAFAGLGGIMNGFEKK